MVRVRNVQMREFLGGVCPHQCTRGGAAPGNGYPQCLCPQGEPQPLLASLRDSPRQAESSEIQSILGIHTLFHLDLILGLEHWACAGVNLLVAGQTFAWFASGSFTKRQKWKHSQITNAAASCPAKRLSISNLSLCVEGMDSLSLPLMASVMSALCVLEALKNHI